VVNTIVAAAGFEAEAIFGESDKRFRLEKGKCPLSALSRLRSQPERLI
jgi:hypothetical protein